MVFSPFPPDPDCDRCGKSMHQVMYGDEIFTYCSHCKDPFPENPNGTKMCEICNEQPYSLTHHISYVFNITIDICTTCHGLIHSSNDHLKEYAPVYNRSVAMEKGIYR